MKRRHVANGRRQVASAEVHRLAGSKNGNGGRGSDNETLRNARKRTEADGNTWKKGRTTANGRNGNATMQHTHTRKHDKTRDAREEQERAGRRQTERTRRTHGNRGYSRNEAGRRENRYTSTRTRTNSLQQLGKRIDSVHLVDAGQQLGEAPPAMQQRRHPSLGRSSGSSRRRPNAELLEMTKRTAAMTPILSEWSVQWTSR